MAGSPHPEGMDVKGIGRWLCGALIAFALVLGPTTAEAAPATSAYTGWAYARSGGTATLKVWKWSAAGWTVAQIPAGQAVWASAWTGGWNWIWVNGAWHAAQ